MRAGVLQLGRWGLLDAVVADGTPAIRRTRFHYAHGETTDVDIRPSAGVPALYAPRRYLLDRLLVDAAAEAGADVLHGLDRHLPAPGGRPRGGRASTGRTRTASRAEGGHDRGRRRHPVDRGGRHRRAGPPSGAQRPVRCCTATYAGLDTDGYEWAYGDGAAAGLIPTNDGLTCVFVGTSPRPDAQPATARRGERLQGVCSACRFAELPERVAAAEPVGRLYGWAGVPGYLRAAGGRAGRWSATPATSRTRSPRTASPTRSATRSCSATRCSTSLGGGVPERESLAAATRRPGTGCRAGCSPRPRRSRRSTGTPTAPSGWSAR